MKKISVQLVLTLAAFWFSTNTFAQVTEVSVVDSAAVVDKRLKFGCGFGLNFVGGTNIGLSPNLIYAVSNKISLGAGLQGNYTAIKDLQRTVTYGANAIFQYIPIERFMTLLEFTQLKVNTTTEPVTGDVERDFWDSALFVGAGLNVTNR